MRISVVIPTGNRESTARRLLENIAAQTRLPDEIHLIEGGQVGWNSALPLADHTTLHFVAQAATVTARQTGLEASTADLVCFFDDDVIIPPDWLETAARTLEQNPNLMGVGGIYTDEITAARKDWTIKIGRLLGIYADGSRNRILPSGWADYVRGPAAGRITPADWLFGCNMAIRRQAFTSPNIRFETRMKAWSFLDDVYLGSRISTAFADSLCIIPELAVIHAPPTSAGSLSPTTVRMRIIYRYLFWRDELGAKSSFAFWRGMLANLLLMAKNGRNFWVVRECLISYLYCLHHTDMDWESANAFVFARHQNPKP